MRIRIHCGIVILSIHYCMLAYPEQTGERLVLRSPLGKCPRKVVVVTSLRNALRSLYHGQRMPDSPKLSYK